MTDSRKAQLETFKSEIIGIRQKQVDLTRNTLEFNNRTGSALKNKLRQLNNEVSIIIDCIQTIHELDRLEQL